MITLAVLNEELVMDATQDRVIILEDEYKSGRDCTKCLGKGHTYEACSECGGRGTYRGQPESRDPGPCTSCSVGEGPLKRTLKYKPCDVCNGTGTSSIVIPDDAKTRPTTGIVKAIGPLCGYNRIGGEWVKLPDEACLKIGDRVLYHAHCGNIFEMGSKNEIKIRYVKESEILGRLHGVVKKSPAQGEFNELTEVGIK